MSEREELESAIAKLEEQRAQLGNAVVDTAIAALKEKLRKLKAPRDSRESGDFSGMRKQVTILFSDLAGFTALSETMDPEDLRTVMNEYFKKMTEAVALFGGTIEKFIGDAVMAIWGVPAADERDPENAVRAALTMRQALEELNAGLQRRRGIRLAQRIGINTGLVIASSREGASLRIVGSAVNVASRLESAAPTGGILISRNTYRHVRGLFDVVELEPLTVKGVSEPIPVYLVEKEKPRAFRLALRGVEGIETPMVGRESEMASLQEAFLDTVRNRRLRVITVTGEAGVGKSRLLYEFTNWLELRPEIARLFKGRIDRPTGLSPYALMKDLFSYRFEIRDDDSPETARGKFERGVASFMGQESEAQAHFLGHLLGFDFSTSPHIRGIVNESQQIRDRAFFFASRLFEAAGRGAAAAALFLEDLHWADDGSLDLVEHLAKAHPASPLLMVCLARPSLFERRPRWCLEPEGHLHVHLKPLDREQSHKLVGEILCRLPAIPPELEDLVVGQAEGFPFYLEEFIKMLIEEGVILKGGTRWEVARGRLSQLRVPPTLTGVLQARLDGLPKEEKETLQMAAMVGRVFWDRAVAHVGPGAGKRDAPAKPLKALQEKELIFERSASTFTKAKEYVFKHALLHDVAYESILKQVRQRYHAQVAAWLIAESGDRAAQLAGLIGEHFERAGELGKAAGWYETAGRGAKDTHAPEAAVAYFQRALSFMPSPSEPEGQKRRTDLLGDLGETLVLKAQYQEAAQTFKSMLQGAEAAGDPLGQARALSGLSWTQDRLSDYHAALESALKAEAIAREAGARAEVARALFRRGWALFRMGKAEAVMELGEQALALSSELEARRDVAFSLKLLGIAHILAGKFSEARMYQEKAMELFEEMGDRWGVANILNNLGECARMQGDYGTAVVTFDREMAILREIGNKDGEIICLSNLGAAKSALGQYTAPLADHCP
jgi:class 3 adenylate cyclase/tetratricopeptide (TPR) repeat protein